MPKQPMIITEASSNSSTRGCYETDESRGQYFIHDKENISRVKSGQKAVKKDIAESEWRYFAERGYLSGIFIWTGIDYRGEPTPLAYPSVYSHFGICDCRLLVRPDDTDTIKITAMSKDIEQDTVVISVIGAVH